MNDRRLTLFPPTPAQMRPVFRVRPDLRARLIAHLEHRGLHVAGAPAMDPAHPALAEITLAPGTPLDFLTAARDTFLAQIRR